MADTNSTAAASLTDANARIAELERLLAASQAEADQLEKDNSALIDDNNELQRKADEFDGLKEKLVALEGTINSILDR